MKLVRPDVDPVREKFARACKELSAALIEREEEVDPFLNNLDRRCGHVRLFTAEPSVTAPRARASR